MVRGLDYYTGPVYEWKSSNLGSQNAFCGGGRYDGLVKQLGGPSFPAAGFACGMERLVELYMQSLTSVGSSAEVWMVMLGEGGEEVGYPLAEELRRSNIQVVSNCSGGDIKKQLRRANRANALIAIIIGDEELAGEIFTIKPLQSGENQISVTRDRLIDTVVMQLKRETMAL